MIKKLLFSFAMTAIACTASAQTIISQTKPLFANKSSKVATVNAMPRNNHGLTLSGQNIMAQSKHALPASLAPKGASAAKAPVTRADETLTEWWGLPMSSSGQVILVGWAQLAEVYSQLASWAASWAANTDYNIAVYVPSNYANAVIDTVTYAAYNTKYSNVKVWFNHVTYDSQGYFNPPTTPEQADHCVSFDGVLDYTGSDVEWVDFAIPQGQEYTIPADGCFIGISFTAEVGASPLISWYNEDAAYYGSYLFQYPYNGVNYWCDINSDLSAGIGDLTIMAHMDVTNCPTSKLEVSQMPEAVAMNGQPYTIVTTMTNEGRESVDSLAWVVTIDGVAYPEMAGQFDTPIAPGSSAYLANEFTFTEDGLHTVNVEVVRVNGERNVATSPSTGDCNVVAISQAAPRTHVVEEFTSTSCGYCPRGTVGLQKLKEMYGDGVITLASHQNFNYADPMYCSDYDYVAYYLSGGSLPSAVYDRAGAGDPYLGPYFNNVVEFGANDYLDIIDESCPSEASVSMVANWADDSKNTISATVNYEFKYDRLDAPYAFAFVLSEDGMSGTTDYWLQYNGYSGVSQWYNSDLAEYVYGGQYMQTDYDHVIVAAWDAFMGADNSVNAPLTAGFADTYTRTLNISSNTLIQNRDNLSLTVLLINRNNAMIVNAAQVRLIDPNGIESVGINGQEATEVARYNANGMKLTAPTKGLNIVKLSDGTSKKVMVK